MDWDVVSAEVTGPLEFEVQFADGLSGKVIMKPASSTDLETIRKRLHDCGLTRISKTLIEVSEDEEIRREIRQRLEAAKRN